MSIKKGNDNGKQQPNAMGDAFARAGAASGQQGGFEAPPQPEQQRRRRPGLMEMNAAMPRPVSRRPTGEVVMKFQSSLQKLMESSFRQGFDQDFRLVVLDNNTANVPLSVLMMCFYEKHNGQDFLAVYNLLVEGSAGRLNPRIINMGNTQVEIETVPGDVLVSNENLWNKIVEHVQAVYGMEMNVLDAGALVLPNDLNPEDEDHMRRVLFNSTQACVTVMDSRLGSQEPPFTVDWINGTSEQLTARLEYHPGQNETATGEPVRSDVRITLQGSVVGQPQGGIAFEQMRELSGVDGYIDLVYCPPQPVGYGQQPVTQHYFPRFVITRADTEIDAITMELQLLALSTTTLLTRNHAWAGVYRDRPQYHSIDFGDIGAIGYEVNFTGDPNTKPEYIDTKSNDFGTNELYQLITAAVHDGLIYSMDIEEVGELSWIHQAFLAAANGSAEATRLIIDAANHLTLDNFGDIYQGGGICVDDNNRVHLGYYIDENGNKRDLRDLDYLAMLNLAGKQDPSKVIEWANTFDQTDVPMEIRLEKRYKLLKGMLGGSLRVTGYARRITFNPQFLEALNRACAQAGLTIRPNNLIQEFSGGGTRGNFAAGAYAMGSQGAQSLFNYGQQQWGGQHAPGFGNYTGRFGRF